MLRILGRSKGKNQKAFASVLEVIVTSIVFVIAAYGILTSIAMLRPHGSESYREVQAAYHAKNVMDYLRDQINAATWESNTGLLATGTRHTRTIGNYTINWYLTTVDPTTYPQGLGPRKLQMNVYYPD